MKYEARFGIDVAVSHGFGLKDPDYWEDEAEIIAVLMKTL